VIPHTYAATNLHELQPGALVNLEADILGKYVERLLDRTHVSANDAHPSAEPDISIDFLQENGYA
jgi:riboflavin synthase